ncbi:MAG: hypothetical protein H7317_04230 [Pseudorhodobacter sp.]|nr:hypothetical protein [Pseudorhodobacter sp.]
MAATDMVGILPRRMALQIAKAARPRHTPAALFAAADAGMLWHHRTSASRAHAWLREQVFEVLTTLDDGSG